MTAPRNPPAPPPAKDDPHARDPRLAPAATPAPGADHGPSWNDIAGSLAATVSGPARAPQSDDGSLADEPLGKLASAKAGAQELARAMPFNRHKAAEHGLAAGLRPPAGESLGADAPDEATGSTVQEGVASGKLGDGMPVPGLNANHAPLDAARVDSRERVLTTNQGVKIADNQNSLRAGLRGATLLEDFILREKVSHFDHERIPERVVHARGSGAHGVFECYESLAEITKADLFSAAGKCTPVFVRFSTVAGERGSADTVRDTRGFAVKFYTDEGNWDLVGNNMPVFFIQDAMKFPDVVHAVKPEPHHGMPQASSAHDTFWDFISLMPESLHHTMWVMSDRGIPRSYRTMQGFGVHAFRLVDAKGASRFVKFHWQPVAGTHSLAWDEAVQIGGADPDFHRRDLWESIEAGQYPEYELALQVIDEDEAERYSFDILDATKLVPEELAPLRVVGRMTLNRNPDNFFAETEQVAFCTSHIVPGIDFSNDPLLHGRNFSYQDTQLTRLGGPNFHEIPINMPLAQVHNNQRDGLHRRAIPRGRVAYEPNSLAGGCPHQAGMQGFITVAERLAADEHKVRAKPERFAEHYNQPRLFYNSLTRVERMHLVDAFRFELSRVTVAAIRERMVSLLANVDAELAGQVAQGLGFAVPPAQPPVIDKPPKPEVEASPALSLCARPGDGRPVGMRIAILVGQGSQGGTLRDLHAALADAQASPRLVAARLGPIACVDGASVEAETTGEAMPSVLWDAVVVGCDCPQVPSLAQHKLHAFVRDQYLHGKPVLLCNDPTAWLAVCGLSGPQDAGDPRWAGVVTTDGPAATDTADAFLAALGPRRYPERESVPAGGPIAERALAGEVPRPQPVSGPA